MPSDAARPLLWWQRALAVGLVGVVAIVAVVVSIAVMRAQADRRVENLSSQATDVSAAVVQSLQSGLSGAAGLVGPDDPIDPREFDAFAREVVDGTPAEALALVTIVEDRDRPAFERSLGRPIVDDVGGEPSGTRSRYYVVTRVTPPTATNRQLVGLDLATDPVRSMAIERALASGETMMSRPIGLLPSGQPAIFFAKPLYRPAGDGSPQLDEPVALITTGYQGQLMLDEITSRLPSGTRLEIRDGDAVLAVTDPPPSGGTTRALDVGAREWSVAVAPQRAVDYRAAWLVGLIGALVVGALAFVLFRGSRYERRLRSSTEAIGKLADLSQELAGAQSVDELAAAVGRQVPAILGAQVAGVAVVDRAEGRVRLVPSPDIPAELAATFGEIDLDAASPIAAAARHGEVLLLGDEDAIRAGMPPHEAGALASSGFSAAGLAPLAVGGSVAAIVGVAWRSPRPIGAAQEAGLRTVCEVCTRTMERIEASRVIVERETALAALARQLSTATTRDDVARVTFSHAAAAVGACYANVGVVEPGGTLSVVGSSLPEEMAQRYRSVPLDSGIPLTEAVTRNQTVVVEDLDAMRARYPAIVDDARQAGFAALVALPLHDAAGTPIGVLGLAWDAPRRVHAALRSTLHTMADMTAQTYERVALADERLRVGELNRRLADVGERLATAGSTEEVVGTVASSAAEAVGAASAAVGVVNAGRGIVHMVDDEQHEGWIVSLPDVPQDAVTRAIASRSGVVVGGTAGAQRGDDPVDGEQTVVAEPLLDHRRQAIGVITVTFRRGQVVETATVRAVKRLAEMAGQAFERASITDAEHRRTSLLATYATELSGARSVGEVIEVVVRAGGLPVDADEVRVALVDEARDLLVVHRAAPGGSEEPGELQLRAGLDPVAEAVVRREPVLIGNGDEWRRHFPDRAAEAAGAGLESTAAMPLRWADGRPLGVVSVGWRGPMRFDDQTNATLHVIARLAAQALQRAALRDIEHQVIADLQERLVTHLPTAPGLSVAARYRAAGGGLEVGGDWFAGFPLSNGRLGLIVGDMTGHGMSAVADMAQVRAMTSALLRAGLSLEDIADQASQFVAESASSVATAMIAVLDPTAETLSCIVAGQVPPVLVHADGTTELLDRLRRPLLGVQRVSAGSLVDHRPFPPGSMFVAYTDGLVERRGELIDEGLARLRDVLRTAVSDPEQMADRVLAKMVGGGHEDDVALVIVQAEARSALTGGGSAADPRPGLVGTPTG